MICVTLVCIQGRYLTFFTCQVAGLVENFNIVIYSDTINVINLKLCMMILLIEFFLCIPLSVTLTIFQSSQQCQKVLTENFVLLSN